MIRRRLLRDEHGGVIVIVAIGMPVLLLLAALVIDTGNWYSHKRQLQNRADAAALAAGVGYSNLANCLTNPTATGTALANTAKQYAGTPGSAPIYNNQIADQSNLTVAVNASGYTGAAFADSTDGGNPCYDHPTTDPVDGVSPEGGLWTDVKVKETSIRSFFGTFGFTLPQITARARVEVKKVQTVVGKGLPFVAETGDSIQCAWAEFNDIQSGALVSLNGGQSNPLPLAVVLDSKGQRTRVWEKSLTSAVSLANGPVAVRYYVGMSIAGSCNYDPAEIDKGKRVPVEGVVQAPDNGTGGTNWINVYTPVIPPLPAAGPVLGSVSVAKATGTGACKTGPSYVSDETPCRITLNANVDFGGTQAALGSAVTVTDSWTQLQPDYNQPGTFNSIPRTRQWVMAPDSTGKLWSVDVTLDPTHTTPATIKNGNVDQNVIQNYDEVGQHRFTFNWSRTSPGGAGTFAGIQQAVYLFDRLHSMPIAQAELLTSPAAGSGVPISYSYPANQQIPSGTTIHLEVFGVDKTHKQILRYSVQATANRTAAGGCWGNNSGASSLRDAIALGCPLPITINERLTATNPCAPQPVPGTNLWDCLGDPGGNKTGPVASGLNTRFGNTSGACPANNWPNQKEGDPRLAFLYLTTYGKLDDSGDYPVVGFLTVYVTGWDGSPASCDGINDDPPVGWDGKGTEVWGYYVDYTSNSQTTTPSGAKCDLTKAPVVCARVLVR